MARVRRPIVAHPPATAPEEAEAGTATDKRLSVAKKKTGAEKRKAIDAVAAAFEGFRPAAKVFSLVRAVPTIFPQLDCGTRIGGWPIERSTLVHGPSNEGKSLFVIGLMASFLMLDHFVLYLDAERTTPIDWLEKLIGRDLLASPKFFAEKPESYEEARELVRKFLKKLIELKDAKKIPRETSAIIVVDSLGKLLPKDMVDELLKATKENKKENKDVDLGGRRWQRQAALNRAWLDELIVLLDRAGASFVPIVRETKDPKASDFAKRFGTDFLPGGGAHLFYESSLAVRIERACWIYEGGSYDKERGSDNVVIGEKHRVTIYKTKVGGKDGTKTVTFFHSSNGAKTLFGFDRARDLLDVALRLGAVEKHGNWYETRGGADRIAQGAENAVFVLQSRPDLLARIEAETREQFKTAQAAALDHDPETGELLT